MSLSKAQQQERAQRASDGREWLRKFLRPGDTVWTNVQHVSRSGMRRSIKVVALVMGEPFDVSWQVGAAVGWKVDHINGGVIVNGCGMDMGFHLVYTLATHLFAPYWECIGEGCPSNDHTNRVEGTLHGEAGYALRHRTL